MTNIFEVRDKTGRTIYLSNKRWKDHILVEHPYLTNKLEEIKETLIKPTIILQSKYDEKVSYYFSWNKKTKEYLMVAVKYLNGSGFIITAYYVKNLRR